MTFMPAITQDPPPPPAQTPTPTAAPKPGPTFTLLGADGSAQQLPVPQTRAEIRGLRIRREQISDQLESVTRRRSSLARELLGSADEAKPGLEARIQVLDQRILQLESDLGATGRALSMAPAELIASTEIPSGGGDSFEEGMAAGAFTAAFFMSILLLFFRRRWKKRAPARAGGQLDSDATQRLQRLETGMEAIAIEIERVSEGQRFVTKLLSESPVSPIATQRSGQPAIQSGEPVKR